MRTEQLTIFDYITQPSRRYYITKPIRLIELFGGIGSQAKALKNIGANFEHYKLVEFDKYAVASYNAIHNTNFTTKDITKTTAKDLEILETDKYCYVMTYSFPCQDLSIAGKQAGMKKGSETRSGLLWEVERLLNETKELPQILLMENVPQVHSKKNILDFDKWIEFLQEKGYCNYWKDLNAKDFGIPQNRNRTFMVSILGSYEYEFPKPFELKLRLKDMLEENVDEKYYLSRRQIDKINSWKSFRNPLEHIMKKEDICYCLTARGAGENHSGMLLIGEEMDTRNMEKILCDKMLQDYSKKSIEKIKNNIRDINDCSSTITANPQRATIDNGNLIMVLGNYSPSNHNASRIVDSSGIAPTVMENHGTVTATNVGLRIRKLTPKECWRLMGFDDESYEKVAKVNSNSPLYKQAGNSIVVNVLEEIFKELL